ncbi:MAG TPA: OmpA family protein [Kofleriaceae bacterium]|jgi:outer membrane protein OmpA-like peptidoglycan-associated protein
MPRVWTLLFAVALIPRAAAADVWATAEAPAALALSDAQAELFKPGAMPAIGLYVERHSLAIGVRARFGALANGPAPGMSRSDPHLGGLGTLGLAIRVGVGGPWLEGVFGGGITGSDVVPAVEAGVGWTFRAGRVDVGPSARFVRLFAEGSDRLGAASLLVVGIDVRIGRTHDVPRLREAFVAAPPPPPEVEVAAIEPDRDAITDAEASCAVDGEGCEPTPPEIEVHDDRIVLDERVLFDTDQARVKHRGRELLAVIAKLWRAHPEWAAMSIEGHADQRGTDHYNLELSERRAQRVREWLVKMGMDPDRMGAVGYGRARPRDPGGTPEALQHNRRVEFVIERRGS